MHSVLLRQVYANLPKKIAGYLCVLWLRASPTANDEYRQKVDMNR